MHQTRWPVFRGWILWLIANLLVPCFGSAAIEPWADSKIPVKDGIELWLDAPAQNAARKARQLPQLAPDRSGDFWFDGSGHGRHLSQRVPDARPKFRPSGTSAAFRFDGKDDHLSAPGLGGALSNATVFVVAAPKSNAGYFRGFVSFARAGGNDYTTGLNLDLGGTATPRLTAINAEGTGFHGQQNLLGGFASNFGRWHVFALNVGTGRDGVKLFVDGQPQKSRERNTSVLSLDELVVGARIYSNENEPPFVQSHLDGDIAEVLIFNRVLADTERDAVEKYLTAKHASLSTPADDPSAPRPLETVANPPEIQMLVPGFTWEALPIQIPNINSIQYRPDGKLVALGYNGHIWLLSDTDGDGLEDKAEPFWDKDTMRGPIGMALTSPGYKLGQGVFVPSKGKVSLILDKDGDGHADEEIIVASGWKEIRQNVDGVGCAIDKDGNIYFGLGTENYANGYLLDDQKKAHYSTNSEHGTVQKVSADFKKRETICTGVRFPVCMAFNSQGDLFCTDQEGATWLPNGNPFDELLHIQPGRHYGFPPRHPKHLPDVVDEPSTFDYFPQHQSTCGLCFNNPVNGGPTFGPSWWAGDAFVAGESRGKIYRTKLVKTAAGYVAQNNLIACLNALTVGLCLSPRGDLIVSTHSGKPDWGTGPQGIGKLYRIRYTGTNAPQPAVTWSASSTEIRIAFDRPLDPANLKNLAKETKITQGKYVMPGDRFEGMYPGYQVVQDQKATPRYDVPVLSASVTSDNRNIVLTTPPRTAAVNYAIELPASIVAAEVTRLTSTKDNQSLLTSAATRKGENLATIELLADLNGVQAEWKSTDGKDIWQGWLPHVDLNVSREFTMGSAEHERLWERLKNPGKLTFQAQLNLTRMLQPEVQPGAELDYEYPKERITVYSRSSPPSLDYVIGGERPGIISGSGSGLDAATYHDAVPDIWQAFEFKFVTGLSRATGVTEAGKTIKGDLNFELRGGKEKPPIGAGTVHVDNTDTLFPPFFYLSWTLNGDVNQRSSDQSVDFRPFPLRRFYLPWATPSDEPIKLATDRVIPELAGGNWLHGRRLFFGEQAGCSKCHQFGGVGGKLGPDLSNLIYRDYASVLKDIREPSSAINPDHIAFNVELTDGELVTGVLLANASDSLTLGDATGKPNVLVKSKVKSIKASAVSLMPEGLDKALGDAAMKDLLTFLLMPPPLEPSSNEANVEPPPPRKRAEVEALIPRVGADVRRLTSNADASQRLVTSSPTKMEIVLCAGPKDHGPGEHDYPLWQKRWSKLLPLAEGVTVSTADPWPAKEQFDKANTIVFFSDNPAWNSEHAKELDAYLKRGGGAVFLHYAVDGHQDVELLADQIGLAWRGGASKFRHGTLDLKMHDHPLAKGIGKLNVIDESYWNLVGDVKNIQLIATGEEEGKPQPLIWTREHGKGRVFVSIPAHYTWTLDDPIFRTLILRGICWTAGQPMDRLAELATVGVRMKE